MTTSTQPRFDSASVFHATQAHSYFGVIALYVGAIATAAMVFVSQFITNWSDASLLSILGAVWAVTFMVIALMTGPLRYLGRAASKRMAESENRAHGLALHDARVMAHVGRTMGRDASQGLRNFQ